MEMLQQVEERLEELQKEIFKKASSKQDYEELAQEIFELRERRQEVLAENAQKNGVIKRINEIEKYLDEAEGLLDEYDEQLVRAYIEKITVYKERFEVGFKAGIEVNIDRL